MEFNLKTIPTANQYGESQMWKSVSFQYYLTTCDFCVGYYRNGFGRTFKHLMWFLNEFLCNYPAFAHALIHLYISVFCKRKNISHYTMVCDALTLSVLQLLYVTAKMLGK